MATEDVHARDHATPQSQQGEQLAAISRGLVQLHSRYYGRGPTKAKTHLVNDTVITILSGGFTKVERTLIDRDEGDAVINIRRKFQEAMEVEFRAVVEEATSRSVVVYMSQVHVNPDLAVEFFQLAPQGGDGGPPEASHLGPAADGGPPE